MILSFFWERDTRIIRKSKVKSTTLMKERLWYRFCRKWKTERNPDKKLSHGIFRYHYRTGYHNEHGIIKLLRGSFSQQTHPPDTRKEPVFHTDAPAWFNSSLDRGIFTDTGRQPKHRLRLSCFHDSKNTKSAGPLQVLLIPFLFFPCAWRQGAQKGRP